MVPGSADPEAVLHPGDRVWVPVEAIQTDPAYYSNSRSFNPDNLTGSKKRKSKKTQCV